MAKGLHQEILKYLQASKPFTTCLEIPAGRGEFLAVLQQNFPKATFFGGDLRRVSCKNFIQFDLTKSFPIRPAVKFDVIISISGIMEFDNTSGFIKQCVRHLQKGGLLIISNDNIMTVRDRLSFLIIGRVRRFSLLFTPYQPTYKMIPTQELYKIVQENDLDLEDVVYCSIFPEDFLFTPLAVFLFLFHLVYLFTLKHPIPIPMRFKLFPFQAFLFRHYFFVCRKRKDDATVIRTN